MNYEAVIGLEVHAQLQTETKLFCGCTTVFGRSANTQTCPVCLGMPGALPALNGHAVELAVRAGLALDCDLQPHSQWSRKNYFYPDLPKGYQISQFDQPYALGGHLMVASGDDPKPRRIALTRIHMEEDAAKSVHDHDGSSGGRSYVDFNRGGTPLVEIVSEPEIRSAEEAAEYMRLLRQILRYVGVCDGNMEQGSLRCDANVSIRPVGQTTLGTRAEIKNINSFRFVQQAITYEIARQTDVIEGGGAVVQETRLWDADAKVTRSMRSKEEAHDYRYFPDPDLPDLHLDPAWIATLQEQQPELPAAKRSRYTEQWSLSEEDTRILTEERETAKFYESAVAGMGNKAAKLLANWVVNEVLPELKGRAFGEPAFTSSDLAELVVLIDGGTISGKIAKEVFADMMKDGGSPKAIVKAKGLEQVSDSGTLEPIIDGLLAEHPDSVASYRAGKSNLLGFFVGQVMKVTRGKANPKLVNEMLRAKLDG